MLIGWLVGLGTYRQESCTVIASIGALVCLRVQNHRVAAAAYYQLAPAAEDPGLPPPTPPNRSVLMDFAYSNNEHLYSLALPQRNQPTVIRSIVCEQFPKIAKILFFLALAERN